MYDLGRVLDEHAPVFPGRHFRQLLVPNSAPVGSLSWVADSWGEHWHDAERYLSGEPGPGCEVARRLAERGHASRRSPALERPRHASRAVT